MPAIFGPQALPTAQPLQIPQTNPDRCAREVSVSLYNASTTPQTVTFVYVSGDERPTLMSPGSSILRRHCAIVQLKCDGGTVNAFLADEPEYQDPSTLAVNSTGVKTVGDSVALVGGVVKLVFTVPASRKYTLLRAKFQVTASDSVSLYVDPITSAAQDYLLRAKTVSGTTFYVGEGPANDQQLLASIVMLPGDGLQALDATNNATFAYEVLSEPLSGG